MLLFLCYTLHTKFIETKHKVQLSILLIGLIISMIVQRPYPLNIIFIQSLIYFTPAYLLGIYCSINKYRMYDIFRAKEYLFLFPFLVILLVQTHLSIDGNNPKSFFS